MKPNEFDVTKLIEECKLKTQKRLERNEKGTFEKKYEPWMCDFVIELAKRFGLKKIQLAVALGISYRTFCEWREAGHPNYHKELDDAVEIAHTISRSKLLDIGDENLKNPNKDFNPILYQMTGRYLGMFSEHRQIKIPGLSKKLSYEQKIECVLDEVQKGSLSASEAQMLCNSILSLAKVEELTVLKEQINQLKQQFESLNHGETNSSN